MDHVTFTEVVPREAQVLAAAARAAGSQKPVPSCPEWTMAKLVKHTGTTHRWVLGVLEREGPVSPAELDLGLPDDEDEYPDWLERGAQEFAVVVGKADPDKDLWSWGADQHLRFWSRRMAHETTVHRWDGETALGAPNPIDAAVAVDGIDERFENLPAALPSVGGSPADLVGQGETIHLHATDSDGEWLLRFTTDGLVVTREHAKGDVAVRGTSSDLLLFALGRETAAPLEILGDSGLLERKAGIRRF